MSKIRLECEVCKKELFRNPSRVHKHNFCSRDCASFARIVGLVVIDTTKQAKYLHEHNCELNKKRMTPEVREKLREARLSNSDCKPDTYQKTYGKHTHRIVAEQKLGRPLRPGEIVHHIDGDKHNNSPDNLQVMTQAEHARLHFTKNNPRKKVIT